MKITKLIQIARQTLTPEEEITMRERARERMRNFNLEVIERYRCGECGVDTLNHSHTFKCSRRGEY